MKKLWVRGNKKRGKNRVKKYVGICKDSGEKSHGMKKLTLIKRMNQTVEDEESMINIKKSVGMVKKKKSEGLGK